MSDEDIFNTPEQEVVMMAKELAEIREILRELSRKLSRIEARANRAFPCAITKHATTSKERKKSEISAIPTMTPEQAMRLYDDVVDRAKEGNPAKARQLLDVLELADLNLLRSELGVSLGKRKPSRRVLMEAVLGRVSESVMLTKHIDRNLLINQEESEESKRTPSEEETP